MTSNQVIRPPTVFPRWIPSVMLVAALLGGIAATILWRVEVGARRVENARSRSLYHQLDRLCDATLNEFEQAKRAMSDERPIGLRQRPYAFERIQPRIDLLKVLFSTCVPSAPDGAPEFQMDSRGLDLQLLSIDEVDLPRAAKEIASWADWHLGVMTDAQKRGWAGPGEQQRRDLLGPLDQLP